MQKEQISRTFLEEEFSGYKNEKFIIWSAGKATWWNKKTNVVMTQLP